MSRVVGRIVGVIVLLALLGLAVLFCSGSLPYRVYVVHTGSMSPTIPSKSAVIVREGDFRVGQVISYRTREGVVTHRLIGRTPDGMLRTKGDANRTADPSPVSSSKVIGGVVAAPRMAGYWLVYFRNPAGLASLFLAVVSAWLLYSLPSDVARLRRREVGSRVFATAIAGAAGSRRAHPVCLGTTPSIGPDPEECLIFTCSRCGMTFLTGSELKAHRQDWGSSTPRRWGERSLRSSPHQPPPSLWRALR